MIQSFLNAINSSYIGNLIIRQDTLFFIDAYFCYVFKFNEKGEFITKTLGQGKGPKEINIKYIDGVCFMDDGAKVFLGSSNDAYIFDKGWNYKRFLTINWGRMSAGDPIFMDKSPQGGEIELYTFEWENLIVRSLENNIYVPIYSQHEYFNAFTSDDYYLNGRILAEINLDNGRVTNIFGRRSPKYLQYEYIGQHSFFTFDINERREFYVNHEIDPNIYIYSSDFELLSSFGVPGKSMDTSYTEYKVIGDIYNEANGAQIKELYYEDRPTKGYYSDINCIGSYTFRSYTKGAQARTDGLQIYLDKVLIGDVDVPKTFRVLNVIGDKFYAQIDIDEFAESIKIYTFSLPTLNI